MARYDSGPRTGPPLPPNPCESLTCPPDTACQLRRSPACLLPLLPCPVVAACAPALPAYSLDRREDEPLTLQVCLVWIDWGWCLWGLSHDMNLTFDDMFG